VQRIVSWPFVKLSRVLPVITAGLQVTSVDCQSRIFYMLNATYHDTRPCEALEAHKTLLQLNIMLSL